MSFLTDLLRQASASSGGAATGGVTSAVSNAFWAVAEAFGYVRDRSKLNNSPPVVNNTMAKDEQKAQDDDEETIAKALKGDKNALEKLKKKSSPAQ